MYPLYPIYYLGGKVMVKEYIKFINKRGGVSQLVDMYDEARQSELEEDGFRPVTDKNGEFIIVTSDILLGEPGKDLKGREAIFENLRNKFKN